MDKFLYKRRMRKLFIRDLTVLSNSGINSANKLDKEHLSTWESVYIFEKKMTEVHLFWM